MKIMHFIHGLNTGGAETLVKNYMLNFDRNKFDIVLVCLRHHKESPYEKELNDAGVHTVYVEDYLVFSHSKNLIAKVIRRFHEYAILRRIVKNEKPDLLHYHMILGRYVKHLRLGKSIPIFRTVHNDAKRVWFSSKRGQKEDLIATRRLIKKSNLRLIVLHSEMKKEISRLFGIDNVVVLNNGIDLSKYKKIAMDRQKKRAQIGVPNSVFVIGHIGRFAYQKNHEFLVNIFKEIEKTYKDTFLLMVGDGNEKNNIENKMREYGLDKKFLILSGRNDIPDILAAMDVFVFPSRYEGLGIALIEAQEAKLPCFVSDAVPEHATISNLVTRLPLDAGPKKWAEEILNYEKPDKVILNDKDWDIKEVTKQLENIYEEALREKRNGKK